MFSACIHRFVAAAAVVSLSALGPGGRTCQAANGASATGEAFDAAPFAVAVSHEAGKSYGICWGEPRKIRRVVAEFAADAALPPPDKVRVQYWRRWWEGTPDPTVGIAGAGDAGWARMDDWTNGRWQDAEGQLQVDGRRWTFTFAPAGEKEFPGLRGPGVAYRRTLKVRLSAAGGLPKPARLQAISQAVCRPLRVRILWGPPAVKSLDAGVENPGRLEAFNGSILAVRPCQDGRVRVGPGTRFVVPAGGTAGIEADLVMAVDPLSPRYDRTIVTVRTERRPFSFAADEVARGDRILVDDLGALVVRGDDPIPLEACRQAQKQPSAKTVYQRVLDVGEQTLPGAWEAMPPKDPLYFVHGLPGNRNVMRQDPNGEVSVSNNSRWFHLFRSPRDSDRKGWEGGFLTLRFGFPADKRGGRELLEGYLPQLRTWWVDGPVRYEQSTILDKLDGDLKEIRLDEPTVLLVRVRVTNTSASSAATAGLHLSSQAQRPEKLVAKGDRVLARADGGARFRCLMESGGRGAIRPEGDGLNWTLELLPNQSHEVRFAIPSITLTSDEEIAALSRRDFAADSRRVCEFWKALTAQGAQIETPEPWLNDFYRAHLRHLEINCLRDLGPTRRYAHVGTLSYGVFPNESVMMISDLERRGSHRTAEQCLQSLLDFQGTVGLPGNFKSADGVFYGSAGSEMGGYNKNQGYVLWCMAEHWWYARDRQWMERAAPKLVRACQWIVRERQATMTHQADGSRAIQYGFLPAGGLEDVQDYWYWLATNTATVWGFDAVSAALADYGHPEAARLKQEAKACHDDVMRGITESRIRTPVVRLRDGTYVPKFPSHLHERGRSAGWIRETLEGSLFLLIYGLVPPHAPEADWILKDYEDNLYISEQYGYAIPEFEKYWFSRGGFSMQANLLDGPMPYLRRDQIKHYLRAYFNGLASAFYPEVRMCNEHSLPGLGHPRGDHFKTSDEAQTSGWLRLIFVNEQGGDLYLGQAIPRYWLTQGRRVGIDRAASHFGPLSLWITSRADQGEILAKLTPPERNRPQTIYLRLRHPQSKPIRSVTLNGKDHDKFDAEKEWIVLSGSLHGPQEVVARY